MRKFSKEIYKLTDEVKKINNGELPDYWWQDWGDWWLLIVDWKANWLQLIPILLILIVLNTIMIMIMITIMKTIFATKEPLTIDYWLLTPDHRPFLSS